MEFYNPVILPCLTKLHQPGSYTCCFWCNPKHGMEVYSKFPVRRASVQAEIPPKGTNIFTMLEPEILFFEFFSSRVKNRKHKSLHLCLLHHLLEWKQNWKPADTESCSTKDKAAISGPAHLGYAIIWKEVFNPSLKSDLFMSKDHSSASFLSCTAIFLRM